MYSKGTGSSNLPLSAINFKGLLNFNKPFFGISIAFLRDSMRDVLKNACGLPVDAKVVQIDLSGPQVLVSEHFLRPDWGSDQFGTCRQFGKQSDWPCVTVCYEKF